MYPFIGFIDLLLILGFTYRVTRLLTDDVLPPVAWLRRHLSDWAQGHIDRLDVWHSDAEEAQTVLDMVEVNLGRKLPDPAPVARAPRSLRWSAGIASTIDYLFNCSWCASFWVGILVAGTWWLAVDPFGVIRPGGEGYTHWLVAGWYVLALGMTASAFTGNIALREP